MFRNGGIRFVQRCFGLRVCWRCLDIGGKAGDHVNLMLYGGYLFDMPLSVLDGFIESRRMAGEWQRLIFSND